MLDTAGYGVLPVADVLPEQLADFRCGKPHLDQFLVDAARDMHDRRLGFTSVVFHESLPGPIAYFTLANDSIPLTDSEKFELDLMEAGLGSFPAVKIGRLAVRGDLQGSGIGRYVVSTLILGTIVDSQAFSASRLIVLDADNDPGVVHFYEQLGFERSLWAEQRQARQGRSGRAQATRPPSTIKMHRDILKA